MIDILEESWPRCWRELGARSDGAMLKSRLIASYSESQRKYHTLQHLAECLRLLDTHRSLAEHPAEVEIALWFHDAIYELTSHENEARSADWAVQELQAAGVNDAPIARVHEHILATRHRALPQGLDQQLLVDIDLSILGAPRTRFDEYERQVREEYAWVPDAVFRQKRAEALREFAARSPIFNTPRLHDVLERQAKLNLAYSLEKLEKDLPARQSR